jgi:hypothetical protein
MDVLTILFEERLDIVTVYGLAAVESPTVAERRGPAQ